MSQITRKRQHKKTNDRIQQVFYEMLVDIKTTAQAEDFYNLFFTSTEKINLPKRLAIFILLYKGEDYLVIRDMLKVSVSTVAAIQKKVAIFGFEGLVTFIPQVLKQKIPNKEIDPDPSLFRGKRVFRNKPILRPNINLPF